MKVFVAGYDVMGKNMAGPGIRSLEIARFLSEHADVTLSFDDYSEIDIEKHEIMLIRDSSIAWNDTDFWRNFDLAILPGSQTLKVDLPDNLPIPLMVDIYDPYILENIYLLAGRQASIREYEYLRHLKALIEILIRADRFIVTSERAKDFFTGVLCSWGYLNPVTASGDDFKDLFLEIPFGISDKPFDEAVRQNQASLPSVIKESDILMLWAGGLWDWLDPLSVIEAMPFIIKEIPDAKLCFMGYKHPNRHVPIMDTALACIQKSKKLKLYDKSVFFAEWTPFNDRIPLLANAKLGVSLHEDHIETRYSFRTRLMDYIWAGIPMVLSGGDVLSDDLEKHGLALIADDRTPETLAKSMINMLKTSLDESERSNMDLQFDELRQNYSWNKILEPLAAEINTVRKISSNPYSEMFTTMLKSFPTVPKPGMIQKGIQKIKNQLR